MIDNARCTQTTCEFYRISSIAAYKNQIKEHACAVGPSYVKTRQVINLMISVGESIDGSTAIVKMDATCWIIQPEMANRYSRQNDELKRPEN
jgi:hypothetical protein